ncbi:MAG: hypothetical protein ACREEE_00875 [Dongiaceae bacterium]
MGSPLESIHSALMEADEAGTFARLREEARLRLRADGRAADQEHRRADRLSRVPAILAGRIEEAKVEAAQFLAAHPQFSAQHWASTQPFQREADRQHFIDGYLKAGLPK